MDGMKKCKVVPPKSFIHSVLPYRFNKKLLLCLCRSCVHEQNMIGECWHFTDAENALENTWVIDEVRFVVDKVYIILEIHEIYQY